MNADFKGFDPDRRNVVSLHPEPTPNTPEPTPNTPNSSPSVRPLSKSQLGKQYGVSDAYIRKWMSAIKSALEPLGKVDDLHDEAGLVTGFGQEMVALYNELGRDAEKFRAAVWDKFDYRPLAVASTPGTTAATATANRGYSDDPFDVAAIPTIEVDFVDVNLGNIGEVNTSKLESSLARMQDTANKYLEALGQYDNLLDGLNEAEIKAAVQRGQQMGAQLYALEEAAKKQTIAAMKAQKGF